MVKITLPNGETKQYERGLTPLDIAKSISPSLAKDAFIVKINDTPMDIITPLHQDCVLEIITIKHKDALETLRHDCSHLLAQAVKELFPETQVTIGPSTEDGFYYDFLRDTPFIENDLMKIEQKMLELANKNLEITRSVKSKNEAITYFNKINEPFKAKIIDEIIPNGEEISLYTQGNFTDLCRGPHYINTKFLRHFKLMKVSGSYWKGDSKGIKLQRIYGTAFFTKKELDDHIFMLAEAQKRDHRKLGQELSLFHISEDAIGSVFWHKNGWYVYRTIQEYIRKKLEKNGYSEVKTPQLINRELWEKSGHWEKYQENMFICEDEKHTFALKPMNCPAHIEIFKQGLKSYKDLPIRMAEFGSCHRNEPSGSLHGIMRVRAFTQDDAHIFCTEEQIVKETKDFCHLLHEVYRDFGFNKVDIKLSTRPQKRSGTDETWDRAEHGLATAIKAAGYDFETLLGEGAFYGPKLEFQLTDAIGRKWQCGTIQLDFVLPERLNAQYVTSDGSKKHAAILHRAILGSFERFIGILIENFSGKLPLWIAPIHAVVCSISEENTVYVKQITDMLNQADIIAELDTSGDTISYKVRKYSHQKVPYIISIGKQEIESGILSVRILGDNRNYQMLVNDFVLKVNNVIQSKTAQYNLS